jgi:hypothetical protein
MTPRNFLRSRLAGKLVTQAILASENRPEVSKTK